MSLSKYLEYCNDEAATATSATSGSNQHSNAAVATATSATFATSESNQHSDVADVADVAVATDTNQKKALFVWSDFVAACVDQGVTAEEVRAKFRQSDIVDLSEEPASKMEKHARTIVAAIKRERPVQPPAQQKVQPASDELRECGQCQRFNMNSNTGSAGLGWCNVREELPMTLPRRQIVCSQYKGAANPASKSP